MVVAFLGAAYVAVVAASYHFSRSLPNFREAGANRDDLCYWTNALIVYVKCGQNVEYGSWWSSFYDFWLSPIYLPMFAMWLFSIGAAYIIVATLTLSPLIFLAYVLYRQLKYHWSVRQNSGSK